VGSLSRESVSGSSNWGLANDKEVLYAYLGSSALAPTTFLAAITNGDFAVDGSLTGTGLVQGITAIRLNANATSTTPDFGEYTGVRSGLSSYGAYLPIVNSPANWQVDATNGAYASTVPNTAAFSITPVPEPESYALALAGMGVCFMLSSRRRPR
jgi:PEP-CTERM motif